MSVDRQGIRRSVTTFPQNHVSKSKRPRIAGGILCSLALCLLSLGQAAAKESSADKVQRYVLIINTYTDSSPWSSSIIGKLGEKLNTDASVNLAVEHLNMLLVDTQNNLDSLKENLFDKYAPNPPAVVVLLGNPAWGVMRKDLPRRFGDVPVLLCAEFNFAGPESYYLKKEAIPDSLKISLSEDMKGRNATAVYYPFFIKENIELLHRLLPDLEEVTFISDGRYIGSEGRKEIGRIVPKFFPDIRLRYITEANMPMDSVAAELDQADSRSGFLFLSWFSTSIRNGQKMLFTSFYQTIGSYTPQPILAMYDFGIDGTMTGGYTLPSEAAAESVSGMLSELLSGQRADRIPIREAGKPETILNYPNLLAKHIPASLFPKGAVYYQKPVSFWAHYKYSIIITALILLAGFILVMVWTSNREIRLRMLSKYRNLFESMPIPYLRIQLERTPDGHLADASFQEMNMRYEKDFVSKEWLIGKKMSELGEARFNEFMRLYDLVLQKGNFLVCPYYFERKDRYYDMLISPGEGKDTINIFLLDKTQLSKTEQLLRTTNHKLAMSLDIADITPWKWDLATDLILCDVNKPIELRNAADEESLSVPGEEYFSKIVKEDRQRVREAYRNLIEGETDRITEEYRIVTHDGGHAHYEWVEAQAAVDSWSDSGKPLSLVGSSRVITERKKLETNLRTAKEKAEEANRLKSAFLANMSHEIRTPLNAIVGFSGILASAEEEQEKQEYVHIIENNNTLLLQLIGDILDLSKIEAGTLEFVYTDIELNRLMEELESSLRLKLRSDAVTLTFERAGGPCHVHTERNRLSQVLINLVTNAIKFTKDGSIRFGYELRGREIYFHVTDTGCGIPADKKDSVFGRFVKLNHFEQGTGLGLSICETIVSHMKGRIGVESEEGKGSTFWFTLPYKPSAPSPGKDEAQPIVVPVDHGRLTILIAEDNDSNYKLFETILRKDYRLLHAWNGQEAVELFEKHRPNIVLMDLNMPVMNGYEATAAIRKMSADVPIVAVTAFAFASDEDKVMESGFDAYMSKPIHAANLKEKLTEIIQKRMMFL